MTMNNVWGKLRKNSSGEYKQFQFCLTLSILLIASYLIMLFSPLVQNTFPVGGDSRKQIYMIFGIAAVGCVMFTLYATGLFLRYKSREIGVFLALGTDRGKLSGALFVEVGKISLVCSFIGILAGAILSFLIGTAFERISSLGNVNHFAITFTGVGASAVYCLFLLLCIEVLSVRFMKRSNVMDILNEQRRQEPIKNLTTKKYLFTGIACVVAGVFAGFTLPNMVTTIFKHWLGAWTNLFYILVVVGLYRIMVYSIASHRKGKRPQNYYNHLIAYGMLKFQGGSIVRNMLVVTLLIMGGLFAMLYTPMQSNDMRNALKQNEAGYSYWYPANANEVSLAEVEALANEYQVELVNYREAEFIQVPGSGTDGSDVDENGNLIEIYYEDYAAYECIQESEYERITGRQTFVPDGSYQIIQTKNAAENIFHSFDTMDKLYCKSTQSYVPMRYEGKEIYTSLVTNGGFGSAARFVISDGDYETFRNGLSDSDIVTQVLFDTTGGEEIEFARQLYREYTLRASENMKIMANYDPIAAKREGADYDYARPDLVVFDADRSERETDWQYTPSFVKLTEENLLMQFAVFFLMFVYVAVICLAAVGVITYTRSQRVGMRNRQVFADIEKLGADHSYLRRLLRGQVQKVYVLPTAVGCAVMFAFEALLLWQNDRVLRPHELNTLMTVTLFVLCVMGYQYMMYRVSLKKVTQMLGLEA